jgi:anti-sigma-K factor RskA
MNYGRRELGDRLAADYVLGLMPVRARRRFERVMARDASLAGLVAGWSERFAPLDAHTADQAPPARVWRAIDRRVGPGGVPAQRRRVVPRWRWLLAAGAAACAAIVLCIAVAPTVMRADLQAVADRVGLSGWLAVSPQARPDIGLSTMRLGVPERERPRWLRAALLLTSQAAPLTAPPR